MDHWESFTCSRTLVIHILHLCTYIFNHERVTWGTEWYSTVFSDQNKLCSHISDVCLHIDCKNIIFQKHRLNLCHQVTTLIFEVEMLNNTLCTCRIFFSLFCSSFCNRKVMCYCNTMVPMMLGMFCKIFNNLPEHHDYQTCHT